MAMSAKVFVFLFCCFNAVSMSLADWSSNQSFTIDYVWNLGRHLDKPMVMLLGSAFINTAASLEAQIADREEEILQKTEFPEESLCDALCCGLWSEWSDCNGLPGMRSLKQRTRECGVNSSVCTYDASDFRTEYDTKACSMKPPVPKCHPHYEMIDNYCLKYISYSGSQSTHRSTCRGDKAELVNINTVAKSNAVKKLLQKYYYSGTIYINGLRPSAYSPHKYTYGGEPDYNGWAPAEPSNGSSELCRVEEGSARKWWDRDCYSSYHAVCEYSRVTAKMRA